MKLPNGILVGIVDAIVVLAGFFAGQFVAPDIAEEIMFVVLALQPVAVAILIHFFGEEVATKIAKRLHL